MFSYFHNMHLWLIVHNNIRTAIKHANKVKLKAIVYLNIWHAYYDYRNWNEDDNLTHYILL